MSLSYTDRENLWIQAGGNPSAAPLAAAVSMAENTSGDPNVVSSTNDIGLWQINLDAHPQYTLSQLQDPLANAKAAVAISNNGGNWSPWVTYTSGAYRQFLSGSSDGSSTQLLSSSSCHTSNVATPNIAGMGGNTVCLDGFFGIGAQAAGLLLIAVGVVILAMSSGIGKQAIKMAGPVGRIASAIT